MLEAHPGDMSSCVDVAIDALNQSNPERKHQNNWLHVKEVLGGTFALPRYRYKSGNGITEAELHVPENERCTGEGIPNQDMYKVHAKERPHHCNCNLRKHNTKGEPGAPIGRQKGHEWEYQKAEESNERDQVRWIMTLS